jgi:endonuclease/exonuclease/phosphatase family metal-dependent hydrolase
MFTFKLRSLLIATTAAILLGSAALADVPGVDLPRKDYVKIAYWNCEHFVDDIDDPYVDGTNEDTGGRSKKDLELYAKAIRAMDADVIVLGETEGEAWVRRFFSEYLKDMKYDTITSARDENWHQNLVFVSRVPVGAMTTLKAQHLPIIGTNETQSRINNRLVILEIMPNPDYKVLLVGTHMKAGTKPEDKGTRLGMVDGIKARLNRELLAEPNANILMMGDMNFTPDGEEYNRVVDGAPNLKDAMKKYGNPPTHPAEYPTRHIDMVFANDQMLKDIVPGGVAVAHPLPLAEQTKTSDHLPIVVSIFPADK